MSHSSMYVDTFISLYFSFFALFCFFTCCWLEQVHTNYNQWRSLPTSSHNSTSSQLIRRDTHIQARENKHTPAARPAATQSHTYSHTRKTPPHTSHQHTRANISMCNNACNHSLTNTPPIQMNKDIFEKIVDQLQERIRQEAYSPNQNTRNALLQLRHLLFTIVSEIGLTDNEDNNSGNNSGNNNNNNNNSRK